VKVLLTAFRKKYKMTLSGWVEKEIPSKKNKIEQLKLYRDLILRENKVRNITGNCDKEDLELNHIIPSMDLAIDICGIKGVDVGSGNGFPGLVIAIMFPEKDVTLIEPRKARVSFLNMVKRKIKLENVKVVSKRAESAGRGELRGRFEFATCRAVAPFRISLELVFPLLEEQGTFFAQVGEKVKSEIKKYHYFIEELGGRVLKNEKNYILLRKIKMTPGVYPRNWKKIKKSSKKSL